VAERPPSLFGSTATREWRAMIFTHRWFTFGLDPPAADPARIPARLRTQFSIARVCAAVAAVAVAFACFQSAWQLAVTMSIGMLIPIFVAGLTWVEIGVILANADVLGALLLPPVTTNCRGCRVRPAAAATTTSAPAPVIAAPDNSGAK
jgi:hypothetical protein